MLRETGALWSAEPEPRARFLWALGLSTCQARCWRRWREATSLCWTRRSIPAPTRGDEVSLGLWSWVTAAQWCDLGKVALLSGSGAWRGQCCPVRVLPGSQDAQRSKRHEAMDMVTISLNNSLRLRLWRPKGAPMSWASREQPVTFPTRRSPGFERSTTSWPCNAVCLAG